MCIANVCNNYSSVRHSNYTLVAVGGCHGECILKSNFDDLLFMTKIGGIP